MSAHWFVAEPGDRSFVVFHDDGGMSMEPVTAEDLSPVRLEGGAFYASAAWSSDCQWYFVVMPDGIALLSVATGSGWYCKKKSAMFIDLFLRAPSHRKHGAGHG